VGGDVGCAGGEAWGQSGRLQAQSRGLCIVNEKDVCPMDECARCGGARGGKKGAENCISRFGTVGQAAGGANPGCAPRSLPLTIASAPCFSSPGHACMHSPLAACGGG
jgi:hypothetical protein